LRRVNDMVGRGSPKLIRLRRLCKTSQAQAAVSEPRIPRLWLWGVLSLVREVLVTCSRVAHQSPNILQLFCIHTDRGGISIGSI